MYPDAFSVERLAIELNHWLKESILKDIFSTSKTDLYFVFNEKKGFKIQFYQGQGFFQFPGIEQFPTNKRMQWFDPACGQKVIAVNSHLNSRSFDILLNNRQRLVFKLFGKFSNVILYDEQSNPLGIFCLNHQKDLQTPFAVYKSDQLETDPFYNFKISGDDLAKTSNWLGKDALSYLENIGWFSSSDKKNVLQTFIEQYRTKEVCIIKQAKDVFELSCFPVAGGSSEEETAEHGIVISSYSKITDAFNDFSRLYIGAESFKIKKQSQVTNLQKQINQKVKLQNELLKSLEFIRQKRSYGQLGDLIMANLYSIHNGVSKVELLDFYNNAKVMVKLKPTLNPQQNAAIFYQKAKSEVKELEFKQRALEQVKLQISLLKDQFENLKEADDAKRLRKIDKMQDNKAKDKEMSLPYRPYKIGGFEVLVGKNAKANDELLSKYTSKNDIWFHAKDVSGSHVIIKNPSSKPIPVQIIEQTASLAAWYSKAKSNSLASVIYTIRKFVRKPKGAPPGQVIIEKEKGILVEPKDYKI